MKQMLPEPNVLLDCVIFFYYLTQLEFFFFFFFFKGKQSNCQLLNMAAFYLKQKERTHILM